MSRTELYAALHVLLDELERRDADPVLLCDAVLALGGRTASVESDAAFTGRALLALMSSGWRPPTWEENRGTSSWSDVGLMLEHNDFQQIDEQMPCLRACVEWESRTREVVR